MCPRFNVYNSLLLCFVCALFCVQLSEQNTIRSSANTNTKECKTWNETLHKCQECNVGFVGTNCNTSCRYPSYGNNCQSQCNCLENYCHPASGCKDGLPTFSSQTLTSSVKSHSFEFSTTKKLECPAGYTGKECDIRCRYPAFGYMCQLECNCSEERCNFAKGCRGKFNLETSVKKTPLTLKNHTMFKLNKTTYDIQVQTYLVGYLNNPALL